MKSKHHFVMKMKCSIQMLNTEKVKKGTKYK